MNKKLFFVLVVIAIIIGAVFLLTKKPSINPQANSNKLKVITTLYPLYDFARQIGQDKVTVTLLLPPGVEPHAFEPKPNDVIAINQADVFIYTGKFMEVWAEDILKGVFNKNLKVVDTSEGITLIASAFHDSDEPAESNDPHIWLDFDNAKIMVDTIAQGFVEKDPANKTYYLNNASSYKKSLDELDRKYKTTLASCATKEIVYGGHYAFGYLAKRYGLMYKAAQGIAPDAEPTANDLITLVSQIKKDNVTTVFYEELTSPKIAETLAKETGTGMLLLNAAHNVTKQNLQQGATYLSIMEDNLANLKVGLVCQ